MVSWHNFHLHSLYYEGSWKKSSHTLKSHLYTLFSELCPYHTPNLNTGLLIPLLLVCWHSLHIRKISPLSLIWIANILSLGLSKSLGILVLVKVGFFFFFFFCCEDFFVSLPGWIYQTFIASEFFHIPRKAFNKL